MKKRILLLCLLAACCLGLCACAAKPRAKAALPPPEALASELLASGAFTQDLSAVDTAIGCQLYALEETDAPSMKFYCSSSAGAEEIAILPCADEAAAAKAKAECNNRLEQQRTLMKDYKPEEVPKLESALVVQRDNTVVLCVAADADKAKAVLDKYF